MHRIRTTIVLSIIAAPFSPIMTHAAFVFAPTNLGIIEASITLSLLVP